MTVSFALRVIYLIASCFIFLSLAYAQEKRDRVEDVALKNILHRTAIKLKSDGRPYGCVGVIFYTSINDELCLLLGRESGGIDKMGTFSEFGGSLELDEEGRPETFLAGCIRECEEESAGLYVLSADRIKGGKIYYELTPTAREVILVFIKDTQLYTTEDLIKAQTSLTNPHTKEKDMLAYVKVKDFLDGKEPLKDVRNLIQVPITLRPFLKKMIEKPAFQEVLMEILYNQ